MFQRFASLVRKHFAFRLLAASLLTVWTLAGCGAATTTGTSSTGTTPAAKPVVRIGYVNLVSMAPAIVGQKEGLFDKNGIQGQFYSFGNGPDLYKALASGKLDVAYAGIPAAVTWASRGAQVTVIAKVDDGKFGVMVGPNSPIQSPTDLKGKEIGSVVQGSGADLLVRGVLLPQAHLTASDVSLIQMPMPSVAQAILAHTIDAGIAGEPYLTMAELQGLKVMKELPDPAMVVLVSNSFLKQHPDAVKNFMKGHIAAVNYLNQNPSQSAAVLAKAFNLPSITHAGKTYTPSQIMAQALQREHFAWQFTNADFTFYQQVADIDYQLKLIDQKFDAKSIFDLSYVK